MKPGDRLGIAFERAVCPRCGCADSRAVFSGSDYLYEVPGEFFVAECAACRLWYQNPRPAKSSLLSIYPDVYAPHASSVTDAGMKPMAQPGLAKRLLRGFRRRLGPFSPLVRQAQAVALTPRPVQAGSVLEVGCASGTRLALLRDQGWSKLCGIELVPAAAERAREQGFSVECGMVEDVIDAFPDKSFDVVVSSMVLEHLFDPFTVVAKIRAKLKPGGHFLFSTVVRDSLDAKIYGPYWAGFDMPRHMVYLTKRDIRRMLATGFEQVKFTHQVAPIDFVRSSSWRIARGQGGLADRIFVALGTSAVSQYFNLALAYLGMTTRVSVSCRREVQPNV